MPDQCRGDRRRSSLREQPVGAGPHELPAFFRAVPVQGDGEPVDQVGDGVALVVPAVFVEERGLVRGELEPGGDRETVVREVEPPAVGQDVLEVGVEVQQPARS